MADTDLRSEDDSGRRFRAACDPPGKRRGGGLKRRIRRGGFDKGVCEKSRNGYANGGICGKM